MFDPKPYLIQLPRRVKQKDGTLKTVYDDYLEVKWRLVWFREKFPHGAIETQEICVDLDLQYARFRCMVETGDGGKATGYGTETAAGFADYVERAETRALGRALAALGIGTQFVGQDLTEGEHVADAPVRPSVAQPENGDAGEFSIPTIENASNGDPRPQTIPMEAGVPCGGVAIEALKPGQLQMLLSKTASLVHAQGDQWVPLLAALQAEKAHRLAPGHIVPVQAPVPTGDVPDHAPPTGAIEAPAEEATAEPDREVTEPRQWGALSRRSMRAGVLPTVWEALRAGAYVDAERVIGALEQATAGRA